MTHRFTAWIVHCGVELPVDYFDVEYGGHIYSIHAFTASATLIVYLGVLGKRPDRTTTTFTTKSTVTTTTLATTPTSTTTTEKPRMERCPTTRTVAIPQGSSTADVNISPGHMVALPVGRYNISITLNNGRRCAVTLKIITGGCMFRN